MHDVRMTCKNCVFAQMENSVQSGCSFNRLDKIGVKGRNEEGFFYFDRICNTSRPKEWLENLPSGRTAKYAAMEEVKPKVGVVINFNENLDDLKITFQSMKDQIWATFKYVIVVNNKVEYNEEINDLFNRYFGVETSCHLIQLLVNSSHQEILDHGFRFAKNGYIVLVRAGYKFRINFLDIIHSRINLKMKRLLVAYSEDKEKILVSTPLWKFLNGNRSKMLESGEVDSRNFYGKLTDVKTEDEDSIASWEELFGE
jgi:hypothetical protein